MINLLLIRDILMYVGMFTGLIMICYIRVHFSERQKKSPNIQLNYNDQELKIRKIGIIVLAITVALALIPAKYLQ